MVERITSARAYVRIVLSDGQEINIKSNLVGEQKDTNYITKVEVDRSLSASSNNPIGVPCSAVGSLTVHSTDLSLMPENLNSPYSGLLNNQAVVYMTLEDVEGQLAFGTYYVDDWYSSISSDTMTEVNIDFSGIMSYINKSPAPSINIEKDVDFKEYLVGIIEKWNESVDEKYRLTIDENKLTFGPFGIMPYSDIDASTYGEVLTVLSQSTLTNIYISNNNEVLTDYYFDDKGSESACNITDCTNAYQYNVGEGLLVKYKGVKVNYSNIIVNDSASIVKLQSQTVLANSETSIQNIDLGSKLFKLNYIQVDCNKEDTDIEIVSIEYSKKYLSLVLKNNSAEDVSVNINVFGQTINNNNLAINKGSEPMLEVTNNILSKSNCETFADKLYSIMTGNNNQLKLTGFFNPRINLGDVVYVDLKAINKTGHYKVHAIKTIIDSTIKTTLTLYSLQDTTASK
jgi:hypothetical protein